MRERYLQPRERILVKRVLAPLVMMLFLASIVGVAVPAQACPPKVFIVSPSGGDDTAVIQAAFDAAVAAGSGSTVKLTAGHFYSSNIFVENFRGTFKGAGQDRTVIDTLRGLDPSLPPIRLGEDGYPSFFKFKNGDIRICDMTFNITASDPAEYWDWPWVGLSLPGNGSVDVIRIGGNANSRIERVRIVGHEGTFADGGELWNIEAALQLIGETGYTPETGIITEPLTGSHTVSDCSFEHVDCAVRVNYLANGKTRITHNTFIDTPCAAFLYDFINSIAEVSYNYVETSSFWGVAIWSGLYAYFLGLEAYSSPLPANALFLVHHNAIRATGLGEAIGVWDFMPALTGGKSFDAIVSDNDITLDTVSGGISGRAQGLKVINNRFSGTCGLAGIYTGGFFWAEVPTTGWIVCGNTFVDFAPGMADIWLDSVASHCLVVARKGTTVLDEGTGNRIIGGIRL